jgi:hypothetical protein
MILGSRLLLASVPFGASIFPTKKEPLISPQKNLCIEVLPENGGIELKNSDNPRGLITFLDPYNRLFKQNKSEDPDACFKIPEVATYRAIQSDHLMKLVTVSSSSLLLIASMFAKNAKISSLPARIGFAVSSIFGLFHVAIETNHLPSYSLLTGRTLPYTPSFPISDATKKNLEIANSILEFTDKKSVLNCPERSIDPDTSTNEMYNAQISKETVKTYLRGFHQYSIQTIPIANCQELCSLGLQMLLEYNKDLARSAPIRFAVPVRITKTHRELLETPNLQEQKKEVLEAYDHIYLLIGDIPEKRPEITAEWKADDTSMKGVSCAIRDISTSDAVICDPWTRSCFPAKDLGLFSYDWLGWTQIEGKWRTCVTQDNSSPIFVAASPVIPSMDHQASSWIQKIKLFLGL